MLWVKDQETTERFCEDACLTERQIQEYFGKKGGYGWHISNLVIYDKPKDLLDFGLSRAPQSWCYVKKYDINWKEQNKMIISQKKLAELLARETADIRRKMEAWRDEAENQKERANAIADKLNRVAQQRNEATEALEKVEAILEDYKDAIGDISEALNSISPTIRLNALKQIRDRITRLNGGK